MSGIALQKLSYGLFVVSSAFDGKDNGCITNSVMQITDNPVRLAVSVNKANYTHEIIKSSGKLNISVISEAADFELFKHFGFQSGRDTDKFKDYPGIVRADNGIYYVKNGCNTFISGEVVNSIDVGTHTIFMCDATDGEVFSDVPSATYAFYHSNIKKMQKPTAKKGWRCKICGYVYEGETLPPDFVCPLCKHGASDFEPIG